MNRRQISVLKRPIEHKADMPRAVILAGTPARMSAGSDWSPKAMLEIGGKPLLWHTLMHFASYGLHDFVVGLGSKGDQIKRYLLDFYALNGDLSIDMSRGHISQDTGSPMNWTFNLVDTGDGTGSGGRIKRLAPHLNETFVLATGEGVSNVDLDDLLAFHRSHGKLATVAAVQPAPRFGRLAFDGNQVINFAEKAEEGWVTSGIFVLEPRVLDYIDSDASVWENEPLEALAHDGELIAYKHVSFWQCLDTLRDRQTLERLWQTGSAPWKAGVPAR